MNEFKGVISRRFKLLISVVVLFVLIVLAFFLYGYETESNLGDFVLGMQTGIFIGTLALICVKINALRLALRDEAALKKLYIEEKDERKQLIEQSTNSLSLQIILLLTSLAAVVSGFFSVTVSITLFAVLTVLSLVMVITKWYYNRKY